MKKYIFNTIINAFTISFILILFVVKTVNAQSNNPPTISEDKLVLGNSFTLLKGQILNGDLAILGGTAVLDKDSQVNGDIAVLGGRLEINGNVNGNVQAFGGSIELGETALIAGSLYNFSSTLSQSEGAIILGQQIANLPFDLHLGDNVNPIVPDNQTVNSFSFIQFIGGILFSILQIFSLSALALILVLIAPKPSNRVARAIIKQPFVHWGIGLLTVLVLPILLVFLTITIVLSPFAIIGVLIFAIALIYGWINLGFALGKRLFGNKPTSMSPALEAAIGTLILSTIARITALVPCIGWFLVALVSLIGLGAIILTRLGTREYTISSPVRGKVTDTNRELGVILAENDDVDELNDIENGLDDKNNILDDEGKSLKNGE